MVEKASVEDIQIDWSFSLDEDLEGDCNWEQEIEFTVESEEETLNGTLEMDGEGEVEAKEKSDGYTIDMTVDFTYRIIASSMDPDYESREETNDGSFEMELDCTLVDNSLECVGEDDLIDGDDVEYIFTR